jgi:NAD(P)-dependent dehydrogenase (short-subunit alcohol dehydrogenase family)
MAIHDFGAPGDQPNYNLTKNSGTLVFQQVARDTPSDKIQIVSFHPGAIFSDTAKALGYTENSMAWDDGRVFYTKP